MAMKRRIKRRKPGRETLLQPAEEAAPQIAYWMVAFMDLLGYRHVLADLDVLPLPTDEQGIRRLRSALERAVRIRQRMHSSFEAFQRGYELAPGLETETPPHLREVVKGLRAVKLISSPGPDHYILAGSLAPSASNFPMRTAHSLILSVSVGMLVQLARGADDPMDSLPLRGGIDIAAGAIVPSDDFLYSPSIVRAYEMEGDAIYPRTLVGSRILDFLNSAGRALGGDIASQYARDTAKRIQEMLCADSDGKVIVDFYGEAVRETFDHTRDIAKMLADKAWDFARAAAVRAKGNSKVMEKYEWLLTYMEARRNLWK